MQIIHVNLGPRSYDIAVTHEEAGLATFIKDRLPRLSSAFIVGDGNTAKHVTGVGEQLALTGIKVRKPLFALNWVGLRPTLANCVM